MSTAAGTCPFSGKAPDFDPFGQEYQLDPGAALAQAREEQPIFWDAALGYWVVTRYEDVKGIFRDHATFSPAVALERITPSPPEAQQVLDSYGYELNRTLVNEDEPAHMPRRRALMEPFTPRELAVHEQMVRRLAREAVDAFIEDGRVDLVTSMLYTVPLSVAMHFLGVPEDDMEDLKEFSVAHTVNTWGKPAKEEQLKVADSVGRFWQHAGRILEKMRADPTGPGWMQYSIRAQAEQPEVVTDSYLHSMMMAGIVAAHETTAHAGANAVKLLLEQPDRWEELANNPGLIPNAVEECLRMSGSVAAWRRVATADTVVAGQPIAAGEKLLIVQAAANRDPRHFEDAERYDPRRGEAVEHLTFGYGPHQCLGKNLARMELQVFLQELTSRLPHLRLAEQEFRFVPNTSFRGPEHLWVEWDPEENPERVDPGVLAREIPVSVGQPNTRALSRSVQVTACSPAAAGVVEVEVASTDGRPLPRWTSGAHIDVDCGVDDGGAVRSRQYSLCGPSGAADRYRFAVLLEAEGRGGSRWLHEQLAVGGDLAIRGPRNHFRLADTGAPLVLIAAGIGITPILAHADEAKARGLDYQVHYSGRSREVMPFLDRLVADHGDRVELHIADEGGRADYSAVLGGLAGLADAGGLAGLADAGGPEVYACGPQRLIDELTSLSEGWADPDALHVEHFTSTLTALDPEREQSFEVELTDSELTLTVPRDRTLLQTLRSANIDVASDCEEGLCGSCEVAVVEGEVDHRDVVLSRSDREQNRRMMSCCSRAKDGCGRLVLGL